MDDLPVAFEQRAALFTSVLLYLTLPISQFLFLRIQNHLPSSLHQASHPKSSFPPQTPPNREPRCLPTPSTNRSSLKGRTRKQPRSWRNPLVALRLPLRNRWLCRVRRMFLVRYYHLLWGNNLDADFDRVLNSTMVVFCEGTG